MHVCAVSALSGFATESMGVLESLNAVLRSFSQRFNVSGHAWQHQILLCTPYS